MSSSRHPSKITDLRRRIIEGAAILAPPVVLATIYYLTSMSLQVELALYHPSPQIYSFWTHSLIHEHRPRDGHLISNITSYLLLIIPCWAIYAHRGRERRFWTGFIALVTLTPIVAGGGTHLVYYEILDSGIGYSRGFSGVVGSIAGFLLATILRTFESEQNEKLERLSAGIYVGVIFLVWGVLISRVAVSAIGIAGFFAVYIGYKTGHTASLSELLDWGGENPTLGLFLVISGILSAFVFAAALPMQTANSSGSFTNVLAHGTGIAFGMIVEAALNYLNKGNKDR